MHKNIEMMVNTKTYFAEHESFVNTRVEQVVSKIFEEFDADKDGRLEKEEARAFIQSAMQGEYREEDFETARAELDRDGDGFLLKEDIVQFINRA